MKKIRKVLATLLAVAMLAGISTSVMAEGVEGEIYSDIVVDDSSNPKYSPEANADIISRGDMLRNAKYDWTIYGITKYYQNAGNTWDLDVMQYCNKTIYNAGCAITSFAMAISKMGYNQHPGDVNKQLGAAACPFDPWQISNKYNGHITQGPSLTSGTQEQFVSFITGEIAWDTPVIVGLTPNPGSGISETHFILAYGYSGNTIYIYDPAYQRNYTQLSSYQANYSIYRAYTVAYSAR